MHQHIMAGTTRIVVLVLFAICVGKLNAGVVEAGQWQPVAEGKAFSSWSDAKQWDNRRSDVVAPLEVAPIGQQQAPETADSGDRTAKFINFRNILSSGVSNEIDTEGDKQKSADNTPSAALSGIYTECLSQFSLTCVQKKVLVFLDRLGRSESFGLLGDFLTVVRTKQGVEAPVEEADMKDDDDMEVVAARFFDSHVVRVSLPTWSDSDAVEGKAGTSLDISLPTTAVEEGRKKKKGGKMMKKLMMMLGMAAAAKMALMIPLGLLIIKIKAVKALIIGKLALMISKFLLIKKLLAMKKGGGGGKEKHIILVHADSHGSGGHGGGGHGGGGGGHGVSDSYGPPSGGGGGHGGGGDSGWSSGGSGGGGHSSGGGGGWSGGGGGGGSSGGWGRSARSVEDPHLIAYRGQINN